MATNPYNPNGPQQLDPVPVVIVDAVTFELGDDPARRATGPRASALNLEYSADGRYLAVAFELYGDDPDVPTAGAVAVWDLSAPQQPVRRFDAASVDDFGWVGLSPDGALLYTGRSGGTSVVVRDVATGELVALGRHRSRRRRGQPGRCGRRRRRRPRRRAARRRHAHRTAPPRGPGQPDDAPVLARWHPLRDRATTTARSSCGTSPPAPCRISSAATPAAVMELAFSPDGATLYTVSLDRSLLAWDLDGSRRFVAKRSTRPPLRPTPTTRSSRRSGERITYVSGLSGSADTMQFLDLTDNEMSPRHRGRPRRHRRRARHDRRSTTRSPRADATGSCASGTATPAGSSASTTSTVNRLAYSADGERILVGDRRRRGRRDRRRHARTRRARRSSLDHGVLRIFRPAPTTAPRSP